MEITMRFKSALVALSSLLLLAVAAAAEQRPHYGGTLRIAMRETPQAVDPASLSASGSTNISRLVFENLIRMDANGRPQPLLASSWRAEPGNQRWRISLRDGVSFTDGFPMDAPSVVASLRSGNPAWKVMAVGEILIIEMPCPDSELPAELALPRNAIVHRDGDKVAGTGPFVPREWTAGKRLVLAAKDDYWHGRPYIDSIEISFGVGDREQLLALDLGKADLVEIPAEGIRRAKAEGRTVLSSEPMERMALIFAHDPRNEDELHARNALAASLDATSLAEYVVQGGGEASGSLLPTWLSGYGFVFPVPRPTQERAPVRLQSLRTSSTLAYDASDPVARLVADRILLNARDAGITIQLLSAGAADIRLARFPTASLDPNAALTELAKALQLDPPKFSEYSVEEMYTAEKLLLQSHRVIPLLHLRRAMAIRPNLRGVGVFPDGEWELGNVWIAPDKP
jgi:MarR-like DNA-binding transcriptional regulator SgrR of sgrS sRNA